MTGSNGKISFTPESTDAGVHDVNMTVRDRWGLAATTEFRLTIVMVDRPPVILSGPPANETKVKVGERVAFSVNASDPDGDVLSVTWKYKNAVLGCATGISTDFNIGYQVLTIIVSDGQSQAMADVTVNVVKPAGVPASMGGGDSCLLVISALVEVILAMLSIGVVLARRRC